MEIKFFKVSVIIPVYNGQSYIIECLDSVFKQTLTGIEVIVVNDGSTDQTGKILKEYETKFSNLIVITQNNNGQGSARNRALEIARGKYIYFLDSDDFIDTLALEKLYENAEKYDAEIVTFNTKSFSDNNTDEIINHYKRTLTDQNIYNGKKFFSYCVEKGEFYPTVWLYFFKKSFLNSFRFIEGIVYEDTPFCCRVFNMCERLLYVDCVFHHRRIHSNSTMTSQVSNYKMRSNLVGLDDIIECFSKLNLCDNIYRHFASWIASTHFYHLRYIEECDDSTWQICEQFIQILKRNKMLFSKQFVKEYVKLFINKPTRAIKQVLLYLHN